MKYLLIPTVLLVVSMVSYHLASDTILGFLPAVAHGEAHAATHAEKDEHGHSAKDEHEHSEGGHHAIHKIVVTSPIRKDVVRTKRYVCQIHSKSHIEVRSLEGGYLEEISVKEGQSVKKGDVLFKILPILYQAKLDADIAEAQLVQVEYDNTANLVKQNIVSPQELALAKAKLSKAQAKVAMAKAELGFAELKAPFDGIVDRQQEQLGSLIEEGDVLTTLSDNSVMWAYFPVPESNYLAYQTAMDDSNNENLTVELMLANHSKFPHRGEIGAIEADFNNETGNIAFRADFPNPDGLLRHGQTGTVLMNRIMNDAIVIPQRSTFEILAKRYVYVIDEENIVHQREVIITTELDDIFVVHDGVEAGEKIILEGTRQVRDGDKVEYEFRDPAEVLGNLKYHAE